MTSVVATSSTSTSGRLLRVLAAVVESDGPVSVRDLGRQLSLSPATTHRMLNTLRAEGFVSYSADDRVYTVGTKLYRLSARVLDRVSVISIAEGVAQKAAIEFNETILFGLFHPGQEAPDRQDVRSSHMSFEVRIDGQQKLLYQIDMHVPVPLLWGASGKAILAFLEPDIVSEVWKNDGRSPATGASPPTKKNLLTELEEIKSAGFAISAGEKLPGARGIAAPVFNAGGVIGSLCLTSPKERVPARGVNRIGRTIADYAKELSLQLGASP